MLTEVMYHMENKQKYLIGLQKERVLKFANIKDEIDHNNLVNNFKCSENKSKDFRNYETPLILFQD